MKKEKNKNGGLGCVSRGDAVRSLVWVLFLVLLSTVSVIVASVTSAARVDESTTRFYPRDGVRDGANSNWLTVHIVPHSHDVSSFHC